MTNAPRERSGEARDPLTSGEVRIAAVAAALRAVKAERRPEPPAREDGEDEETPAVARAA